MNIFTLDFSLYYSVIQRFLCFIMLWNHFQNWGLPHPVFKHLTGHFNKIFFNWSSCKSCIVCFIAHVVHNMPKFMEENDYLLVSKQRRFIFCRRVKVCHHCCRSLSIGASLYSWSSCQGETTRMVELIRPRIKIEVEVPYNILSCLVPNFILCDIFVPCFSSFYFFET